MTSDSEEVAPISDVDDDNDDFAIPDYISPGAVDENWSPDIIQYKIYEFKNKWLPKDGDITKMCRVNFGIINAEDLNLNTIDLRGREMQLEITQLMILAKNKGLLHPVSNFLNWKIMQRVQSCCWHSQNYWVSFTSMAMIFR